mmetsp:Transcript_5333/g.19478  ORF Transcript_5333/g.19478 Transcript_5333/m.19478 type:complete len:377 (-) Transcript_5333:88-1218(-)
MHTSNYVFTSKKSHHSSRLTVHTSRRLGSGRFTPKAAASAGVATGTPAPAHANRVPLAFAATQNKGTSGSTGGMNTHAGDASSYTASMARTTPALPTIPSQPPPIPHALMSGVPDDIRRNIPHVRVSVKAIVPSSPTDASTRPSSMNMVVPTMAFGCGVATATTSPKPPPRAPSLYTRIAPSEHPHAKTPNSCDLVIENKYPGDQRSGVDAATFSLSLSSRLDAPNRVFVSTSMQYTSVSEHVAIVPILTSSMKQHPYTSPGCSSNVCTHSTTTSPLVVDSADARPSLHILHDPSALAVANAPSRAPNATRKTSPSCPRHVPTSVTPRESHRITRARESSPHVTNTSTSSPSAPASIAPGAQTARSGAKLASNVRP